MATQEDIRTICLKLPGSIEGTERFGFSVSVKGKLKGYVWSWAERVDPKRARVINDDVVAIVVPNEIAKFALIESEPEKYFTEPHYNGFNAVLVRLDKVTIEDLEDLLLEAWRCKVPSANPKLEAIILRNAAVALCQRLRDTNQQVESLLVVR